MLVDFSMALTEAVLGADVHLTSTYRSEQVVIDWDRVARAGIAVQEQRFTHPVYAQPHGSFVPGLSVIDLLCNCGPDAAHLLRDQPEPELALPARAAA